MKLFRVTIEYAVIVVARDQNDAEQVAELNMRAISDWETPSGFAAYCEPIQNRKQLSDGWDASNAPYGIPQNDARQTIAAWLDSPDPLTESELEAHGQTNLLAP